MKNRSRQLYIDRSSAQLMRSRKLKRRRKRRMKRLVALLVFFLLIAVTTLSLTVFFKTEKVEVVGITRYNHEDIIEKSGIKTGENLIMLNTAEVGDTLQQEFVYIENVRIKKNIFTGTAKIIIEEATPFCTLTTEEGYYLVSRGGTVLERLSDKPSDMYTVTGLSITDDMIGKKLDNDGDEQLSVLEEILSAIESTGIKNITDIDIGDVLNIVINYENRVDIEFGTRTELEYKMKYAKEILENSIKSYERGTLDVSYCHTTPNAVFSPIREEISSSESSEEPTDESDAAAN